MIAVLRMSIFWSLEAARRGSPLAMDRAKAGSNVAMVERDKIGGTCINVACIPTKAVVGSARTVLMARHAEVMGVELSDQALVSVDGLRRHKSSVVDGMDGGPQKDIRRLRHGLHLGYPASSRRVPSRSKLAMRPSGCSEEPMSSSTQG